MFASPLLLSVCCCQLELVVVVGESLLGELNLEFLIQINFLFNRKVLVLSHSVEGVN